MRNIRGFSGDFYFYRMNDYLKYIMFYEYFLVYFVDC